MLAVISNVVDVNDVERNALRLKMMAKGVYCGVHNENPLVNTFENEVNILENNFNTLDNTLENEVCLLH